MSGSVRLVSMPPVGTPVLRTGATGPVSGRRHGRGARVARGGVAALLSTGVALASHLLAGAPAPGALGILVPLVLAAAACIVLAGVRLSALRLSLSVVSSQLLFHTFFVLGTVPAGAAVAPAEGGAGHHALHGHDVSVMLSSGASTASHTAHAGHGGGWMWLAHGAATVLTVVALRRGERAVARLLQVASAVLVRRAPRGVAVLVVRRPLPVVEGLLSALPALSALTSPVARRGPPVVLAV